MTELEQHVRLATLAWVERVVVGLDLCPFARGPLEGGRVRVAVTSCEDPRELLTVVDDELDLLLGADAAEIETTLLVHPRCLTDFGEYNDFLDHADRLLELRELGGVVQIASFHPDYCFVDSAIDDPANFSNRSPYPMLHLLRESSVSRAVESHPDIEGVPSANMAKLRSMSLGQLRGLFVLDER
ncbi:MAG: DUF1415 domain-containing protein [Enhygromyxa sp.]